MIKALLASLLSPKVEAQIMITHTIAADNVYRLQNMIQMWGFPGRFRVLSPHMIQVELEGHQANIEARLDQLSHNVTLQPKGDAAGARVLRVGKSRVS